MKSKRSNPKKKKSTYKSGTSKKKYMCGTSKRKK